MPKQHVKVIKVPLRDSERSRDRPQAFPPMPVLYLELLENKAKIKQDLINKHYVPNNDIPRYDDQINVKERYSPDRYTPDSEIDRDRGYDKNYDKDYDRDRDYDRRDSESDYSDRDRYSTRYNDRDRYSDKESDSDRDRYSDRENERSDSEDDLCIRLKELLNDSGDDSVESFDNHNHRHDRQSRPDKYSRSRHDSYSRDRRAPPTLEELERKGEYNSRKELRDINQVNMSEYEEEDAKREMLFKFEILRKSYKSADIPEFSVHSDLHSMQKTYEDTLRRLSLDSTVESYKTYLIGGFMLVEFVCGNWLGFDMQGFTQQQIISMASYEKLLIELGEKSYVPEGSAWPVELRLLFMMIMNAAFFIVSKMIMKKTGANLLGMINGMNTSPSPAVAKKRRMKGPTIDLDDIPDLDDELLE